MKGICLEDVANFVHLSPHYVSRLFKKEAKTTFINYVTERKIAHAKELLKTQIFPLLISQWNYLFKNIRILVKSLKILWLNSDRVS